jgi:AcrR family transcriptional regulator
MTDAVNPKRAERNPTAGGSAARTAGAGQRRSRKRGTVNKDVIMGIASSMFRERGYDRTSLEDIASALSITKPSLYYHFSSKEDILLECISRG